MDGARQPPSAMMTASTATPEQHHDQPVATVQARVAAPGIAAEKKHRDRNRGRDALGHARIGDEDERQHDRKSRQEHEQEDGHRAAQVLRSRDAGPAGAGRLREDPLPHALELRRAEAPDSAPISPPMRRCACSGRRRRTARTSLACRPRATMLRSTYITPSTKPQAMLQPIAANIILRTSSRPVDATLSVPVKVSTMNRPNRTSETRSIGSSTRALPPKSRSVLMAVRPPFTARAGPAAQVEHEVDHPAFA